MKPNPTNEDTKARDVLAARVLSVTAEGFDELAIDIFRYQFTHNPTYREYCRLLHKDIRNVQETTDIPFLPIGMFKTRDIHTNAWNPEVVFESSTTTGQIPNRHAVRDLEFYHAITRKGFAAVMRHDISAYRWLALLPSYIERPASSLINMISYFIAEGKPGSAFIHSGNARELLLQADAANDSVAFISVSFALADLAEKAPLHLKHTMIIETGGMKGRRAELTRQELHEVIKTGFGVVNVCSEYGMTELLSQGWSKGDGIYHTAPSLRILTRDLEDPLTIISHFSRGGINCIDLANLDTCAFIATDDIGRVNPDGSFEVLGRFDASELRGCNLMVDQA